MLKKEPLSTHKNFNLLVKWILLSALTAIIAGCSSALFLWSLDVVTGIRFKNPTLIYCIPIAAIAVGLLHHYIGKNIDLSNNAVFSGTVNDQPKIHWKTAPLLMLSTLITHLFGGSAGREGAALQLSGSLNHQWNYHFGITPEDRKILMRMAIAAGFGAVFSVPFAGAIFAIEVVAFRKFNYTFIVPIFLTAWLANNITLLFIKSHSIYPTVQYITASLPTIFYSIVAGITFGLAAVIFSIFMKGSSKIFEKISSSKIIQLLIGSILLVIGYGLTNPEMYAGLGIETIVKSFHEPLPSSSFFFKLLFTVITISAGFKGGEVTPLFFIGATLGNTLFSWIPLPIELLAAMGFVAVFAAATRTPIASTIMAIEVFGFGAGLYCGIACVIAAMIGWKKSIYAHHLEKI